MRFGLTSLVAAGLVTACASGGIRSTFEFQPESGPLRYAVRGNDRNIVDTPMGTQETSTTSSATVVIATGARTPTGVAVTATFEVLEGESTEQGTFEGGDILGKSYAGVIHPDGMIEVVDGPETPAGLKMFFDPRGFLRELLLPLPPKDAPVTEPWTVRRETVWDQAITMTSVSEGTARVVGDTVWNSVPAKVILFEATASLSGTGMPEGSPAELDFAASGPSTTHYVWDAVRGVMLAALSRAEVDGTVTLVGMGVTVPITFVGEGTIELQQPN